MGKVLKFNFYVTHWFLYSNPIKLLCKLSPCVIHTKLIKKPMNIIAEPLG